MPPDADRSAKRHVAIVYRSVYRYRKPFYEELKKLLDARGVRLTLVYGQPGPDDAKKGDTVDVPWGRYVESTILTVAGREIYWQPVLGEVSGADLVIVEQATKLLANYALLAQQALGMRRVAFWGHGRNFQRSTASPLGEWVKRLVSTRAHWWFAYNRTSAEIVASLGFPRERITNVRNAIDTRDVMATRDSLPQEELRSLRQSLGIDSERVGVYVGGMYAEKRVGFLLKACEHVRARVPDFEVVFIGSGVDCNLVEEAAAKHGWVHWVGPKFGAEMVRHALLGRVMLMPGLVGLAVLDSFAMGIPMVTTDVPDHSPEIEYLDDGVNGVKISATDDPGVYADAVAQLLLNEDVRQRLVRGCLEAREAYSIEEMARRFADGIERALAT